MKIRFGNDKNKHVQIKMARTKRVKTCEGCSALIDGDAGSGFSCYLGYVLDSIKGIPVEKCPKPRSNTKMVKLYLAGKSAWITSTN